MIAPYIKAEQLLKTRKGIFDWIEKYPGIHFRELQRKIRIGTGNLEYHLTFLEKANLIKAEKLKGNKRYFPLNLNESERKILGILRQKNFRKIIILLLSNQKTTHKDIINFLKISPSSVTWYLNQLEERNMINASRKGRENNYALKGREEIIKILISYKKSFLDTLVDKFVEAWE